MTPSESRAFVEHVRNTLHPGAVNQPIGQPRGFQVVKTVAWQLRDRGYGLVRAKPGSQNNVEGYTGDVIARPDGFHVDILVDGEGAAFATWQPHDDPAEMAAVRPRWAPALEMPALDPAKGAPPEAEALGPGVAELQQVLQNHRHRLEIVTDLANRNGTAIDELRQVVTALASTVTAVATGPGPTLDDVRTLLVSVLTQDLEVEADVVPAGPVVKVLGRTFDLNHDHGVEVVLKLFGQEVRRASAVARVEPPDPV